MAGASESSGGQAATLVPPDIVFAPVRSQTAFEETVERLGTAIKLGLLPPGSRLPAERELGARLGIARSTLLAKIRRYRLEEGSGAETGAAVAKPEQPLAEHHVEE